MDPRDLSEKPGVVLVDTADRRVSRFERGLRPRNPVHGVREGAVEAPFHY